tara:strand:+ start:12757 stop:13215 length:459 start_codon:yes stop_codon:yes gene_type:complete
MRYFKKCEDFAICGSIGLGGEMSAETSDINKTLFQIGVRGGGRVAEVFDSNYIDLVEREIVDVSNLMGKNRIYLSAKDYEVYGFNPLDPNDKWTFKQIYNSFRGDEQSWLINFDGKPVINNKSLKRMDYAKLADKWYDVEINGAIVGVFTKV